MIGSCVEGKEFEAREQLGPSRIHSLCEDQRIVTMPLSPQRQRLQPLQEQERREWVQRRTEIPERLEAQFDNERAVAELFAELQSCSQ